MHKDFGYTPTKVNINKTLSSLGIYIFQSYNRTLIPNPTCPKGQTCPKITDGGRVFFNTSDPKSLPMPHVFFKIDGGEKATPPGIWVQITSLMNETGYLNCTKVLDMYNNHPGIPSNLTINDDLYLPPNALEFKFSINNASGLFRDENATFPVDFIMPNLKLDSSKKDYYQKDITHQYQFNGLNNLIVLYISAVH